jgi:hypothetical protein
VIDTDGRVTRKLGHNVRLTSGPTEVACTSVCLDDREWELLRALPAEIDDGDASPCALPFWLEVIKEVTTEEQWTAAKLAT